ncbi:hypothetical protein ACFQ9H_08400 [Streptomyces sp. NPDC056517]|uniref:hypothetical protein n=1 Tax=unclassified Streptomyces TaxID=2593676 RepID=UPI0036A36A34
MRLEKLNSAARRAVMGVDNTHSGIRVLIRLKANPDDQQQRLIADAGARVTTVAGDVVTASLALKDLGRLTELDCVDYVELSQPLYPEIGVEAPTG